MTLLSSCSVTLPLPSVSSAEKISFAESVEEALVLALVLALAALDPVLDVAVLALSSADCRSEISK